VIAVDLEGRTAFVTGAGHGIGRAQAGRFAEVTCERADLADPEQVERAFDRPIDILINNAGALPLLQMSPSQWEEINQANLDTTFLCLRAAARTMIRRGTGGSIVNVASTRLFIRLPTRPRTPPPKPACSR